jgi:hypothetical protein
MFNSPKSLLFRCGDSSLDATCCWLCCQIDSTSCQFRWRINSTRLASEEVSRATVIRQQNWQLVPCVSAGVELHTCWFWDGWQETRWWLAKPTNWQKPPRRLNTNVRTCSVELWIGCKNELSIFAAACGHQQETAEKLYFRRFSSELRTVFRKTSVGLWTFEPGPRKHLNRPSDSYRIHNPDPSPIMVIHR